MKTPWWKNSKQLTAYFLFGAICLVFVFFGLPSSHRDQIGSGYVAEVNDAVIPLRELQRQMEEVQRSYQQAFGENYDFSRDRDRIRNNTINALVNHEVSYQAASRYGMRATDQAVQSFIVSQPLFQKDGRFQRDFYNNFLVASRLDAVDLEEAIRKDLSNRQLHLIFGEVMRPTEFEVSKLNRAQDSKIEIEFVKLNAELLSKNLPVAKEQVDKKLLEGEFLKTVEHAYQAQLDRYTQKEQIRARHILIKVKDEAEKDNALERAKKIYEEAKKEDFAQLARRYSEDEGSKDKGGDLGYFARGAMVPEFEAKAFSLNQNEISEPVRSSLGYHVIRLEDKKPETTTPLSAVKLEIAQSILRNEQGHEKLKQLESFFTAGNEKLVNEMLKLSQVNWQTTGEFNLAAPQVPQLPNSPEFIQAAFSMQEVGKTYSKPLSFRGDTYLMRLKKLDIASESSLEKVMKPVVKIPKDNPRNALDPFSQSLGAPLSVEQVAQRRTSAAVEAFIQRQRSLSRVEIEPSLLGVAQQ